MLKVLYVQVWGFFLVCNSVIFFLVFQVFREMSHWKGTNGNLVTFFKPCKRHG